MRRSMVKSGLIGTIITAVCCFTPVLVIGFGAVGLAAFVPLLDFVLFPLLASFLGMTVVGLFLRARSPSEQEDPDSNE